MAASWRVIRRCAHSRREANQNTTLGARASASLNGTVSQSRPSSAMTCVSRSFFARRWRRGANLFAVIASWPSPRIEHWTVLSRARAIENQAYFAGVSRSGTDPYFSYLGRSLIVDPRGKVLVEGGDEECLIGAHVEVESLRAYREELPFLCDFQK